MSLRMRILEMMEIILIKCMGEVEEKKGENKYEGCFHIEIYYINFL
mgnify:FL=1